MNSRKEQLKNRGFIEEVNLEPYREQPFEVLERLLLSKVAIERTIAATLLRQHENEEVVFMLIDALKIEKKLYAKIAICDSLSSFGKLASNHLVNDLGSIGKNQHKQLPEKVFGKKNYPLPRDIFARTLSNMGLEPLSDLKKVLETGTRDQKLEAIDAVGFITFYHPNKICFDNILELFSLYDSDDLMIWKLLRCLQSFNEPRSIKILNLYSNSDIEALRFEANRSLDQLK